MIVNPLLITGPNYCQSPSPSHRRQGEEGDGEDGEAGGDDLAHPGPGHGVAVADRSHRDLKEA